MKDTMGTKDAKVKSCAFTAPTVTHPVFHPMTICYATNRLRFYRAEPSCPLYPLCPSQRSYFHLDRPAPLEQLQLVQRRIDALRPGQQLFVPPFLDHAPALEHD